MLWKKIKEDTEHGDGCSFRKRRSGKSSLRRWYLDKDLKGVLGRSGVGGRGFQAEVVPEVETCWLLKDQ